MHGQNHIKSLFTSTLPHTRYMPRPSHSSWFDHPTICVEQYRPLSSSLCNFLHSLTTSSLLGPNNLLSTQFSNTLSLRSALNVSDQVSHPYNTTCKITVQYILIFIFWVANWRRRILHRKTDSIAWPQSALRTAAHRYMWCSLESTCSDIRVQTKPS